MDAHGIPCDPKECPQSPTSDKVLTESPVEEKELEARYRWQFDQSEELYGGDGCSAIDRKLDVLFGSESLGQSRALRIPEKWFDESKDLDSATGFDQSSQRSAVQSKGFSPRSEAAGVGYQLNLQNRALKQLIIHANLMVIHLDREQPFFEIQDCSRAENGILDPSNPNLAAYTWSRSDVPNDGLTIDRALYAVLTCPSLDSTSELDCERVVGAALAKLFNTPSYLRYSETLLQYPYCLGCCTSNASPDHATQMAQVKDVPNGTLLQKLDYCRPLIMAAECKREAKWSSNRPVHWQKSAAQLASAYQPTLQMFIIDLVMKYKDLETGTWSDEFDPFNGAPIPEHMFLLGVIYDADGVQIYSFSPRYELKGRETKTVSWGFRCRLVPARMDLKKCFTADHRIIRRSMAALALLTVKEWGHYLTWLLTGRLNDNKDYTVRIPGGLH